MNRQNHPWGRLVVVTAAAFALSAACSGGASSPPTEEKPQAYSAGSPVLVGGNPSCASLGRGSYSKKIEEPGGPPVSGVYDINGPDKVTVNVAADGKSFTWSSTLAIDAVIVKGGPQANVYAYTPEATVETDSLSSPPLNDKGKLPEISHIEFCYDYEVTVAKTAVTSFKRTFEWTIDKMAALPSITLAAGQVHDMGYTVVVGTETFADSDFAATGTISIFNPAPDAATIEQVADVLPGGMVSVTCPASLPYQLPAGHTLVCSYVATLPDAADRVNTATVTTSGDVGGGSAQAPVIFGAATVIDGCVTVTDTLAGPLGEVCLAAGQTTLSVPFQYLQPLGPFACGQHTVDNTAGFTTKDLAKTGSATATVSVQVDCPVGCSLTPGYWKTHSSHGPAPYDDAWASLAQGADTVFFLAGASYHKVLWTPPAGNAYYILAHAFIAAKLNGLNGADTSAVSGEMTTAAALFASHTPTAIGALKGNHALRRQFVSLAGTLDQYNNGIIGPGHCSE